MLLQDRELRSSRCPARLFAHGTNLMPRKNTSGTTVQTCICYHHAWQTRSAPFLARERQWCRGRFPLERFRIQSFAANSEARPAVDDGAKSLGSGHRKGFAPELVAL